MSNGCKKKLDILCGSELSSPIIYRKGDMPENACYPLHSHAWGEFVFAYSGSIEIQVDNKRYLLLPDYGIWVPPHIVHQCCNTCKADHCSIYFDAALCTGLSERPAAVKISGLMHSMLEHLRNSTYPDSSEERIRFLQVFLDILKTAPCVESWIPVSADPELSEILRELEEDPGDDRSVKELAGSHGISERTLARKCRRELGVTLREWRQRLRAVKALALIEEGRTIESVALDMGYASASAFIAMFRKIMGRAPSEFRQ